MARTSTTTSVEILRRTARFVWPDAMINLWVMVMLAAGGLQIGVFATFVSIQNRLQVGIPWLFPFGITVGTLTIAFILFMILLIFQRRLMPSVVMVLTFILFALFLTGLIETAIQLFGSNGNVNSACQNLVAYPGTLNTLAFLQQREICNSWYASFAFWIIGTVFLVWLFIIAVVVGSNGPERDRY